MKTLSKAQLREKAAEVFKRNPKESKLYGTLDGNIFVQKMESAARNHAKVRKLDVIEFSNPDAVQEVKGSAAPKTESKSKGDEKTGGKYDDLKRKELDEELKGRDLNPKDYANIAACIAALEADDLAAAEKAAAEKAEADKAAAEKAAESGQENAGTDEGQE